MPLDYTGVGAAQFDEPATMVWGTNIPVIADTVLEIRLKLAKISGSDPVFLAGLVCYNFENAEVGQMMSMTGTVTGSEWHSHSAEFADWPAGTVYARMVFQHQTASSTVQIDEFSYEDITAPVAAEAAIVSAESAETSSTEAGDYATASNNQRILAEAAQAGATVSRDDAVAASSTAAGQAAIATSAKNTAIAVATKGVGALNDMLMPYPGANVWEAWNNGPSVQPNEIYPMGNTLTFDNAATDSGISLESNDTIWTGPSFAEGFRLEIEFELVSGSLAAAGILFDFYPAEGSYARVGATFEEMVPGPIVPGAIMLASHTFLKPDSLARTVNYNRVYLMANYDGLGTKAANNFKVHRVQIYPINNIEASVSTLETALVDMQGNAAAGYLIKAQANNVVSLLELTANDGSTGSVSVAKLEADTILLNGSVKAGHFDADSMNVAGLSIFDNRLQSTNFVTDVSGWMIDDNGDMELNNLVVRESVVVGAVSNGITFAGTGGRFNSGQTVAIPALGPMELGEFFQIAVMVGYSYWAKNQVSTAPSDKDPYGQTNYSYAVYPSRLELQRSVNGGAWTTLESSPWTNDYATWDLTFSMHGTYSNVELRLIVYTGGASGYSGGNGSGWSYPNNVGSIAVVGRALVR
jgi:hypothetical protein